MSFSKFLKICIFIGGIISAILGVILLLAVMHTIKSLLIIHPEEMSVRYIMKYIDEFEDDFHEMGFDVKIAYTRGDIGLGDSPEERQRKLGYRKSGILVLRDETCEYWFDIGFDRLDISIDKNRSAVISKITDDKVLDLKVRKKDAPVSVSFSYFDESGNSGGGSCNYNTNFIDYFNAAGYGEEIDNAIKKYISAEELRRIYENCIALQDKLVELHKEHNRQRITLFFNSLIPWGARD